MFEGGNIDAKGCPWVGFKLDCVPTWDFCLLFAHVKESKSRSHLPVGFVANEELLDVVSILT